MCLLMKHDHNSNLTEHCHANNESCSALFEKYMELKRKQEHCYFLIWEVLVKISDLAWPHAIDSHTELCELSQLDGESF